MTVVESSVHVRAPAHTVWDFLTDKANVQLLYPSALWIEIDPPHRGASAKRYLVVRRKERGDAEELVLAEVIDSRARSRVVAENRRGGVFKHFQQTITLEQRGRTTAVKLRYEYEVSVGALGRVLNDVIIEHLARIQIRTFAWYVKDLVEFTPLRGDSA